MIDWKNMVKAAKDDDWNPIGSFDINGDIPEGLPVDQRKALVRALLYGVGAGGVAGLVHYMLSRNSGKGKKSGADRAKELRRRIALSLGVGAAAAGIGYGHQFLKDAIRGTRFNYAGYKPAGKGDYNIFVAGAGSGAHDRYYTSHYDSEFKHKPYAIFNPNDMDEMKKFVDKLPEGSRVRIWGHSKGGRPAWELANYAASTGKEVNQLNTVDIVGKPWDTSSTPESVRKAWTNYVIEGERPFMNPSIWSSIKSYLLKGYADSDLVATLGGLTGRLEGADNRNITNRRYRSHREAMFGALRGETDAI